MKKTILIFSCLLITVLCNCAKTPEDVQKRADILDEKEQTVNTFSKDSNNIDSNCFEYGTLEQIRNQLMSDIANNNTPIKVSNARVGTGEIMPVYDVRAEINELGKFSEICNDFYNGKYDVNKKECYQVYHNGEAIDKKYPAYEYPFDYDNDGSIHTANAYPYDSYNFYPYQNSPNSTHLFGTGAAWGDNTGEVGRSTYLSLETECIYNPLREEISDEIEYVMHDGNFWRLNDAIHFAEKFINESLGKVEIEDYTHYVQTVCVQKFEDETYSYLFEFVTQDFNGNYYESENYYPKSVYDYYSKNETYMDKVFGGQAFPMEMHSFMWLFEKDTVNRFAKAISFKYEQSTDDGDDLLTLYGAINHLDQKLANKKSLEIECAELNYVLYCKEYDIWQKWYDGKWYEYCVEKGWDFLNDENGTLKESAFFEANAITDCELELRPVWVFSTVDTNIIDYYEGEKYYVDALTGEVTVIR